MRQGLHSLAVLVMVVAFATAASAGDQQKLAVLGLTAKAGIEQGTADSLADLLASSIQGLGGFSVIGKSDIRSMIGFEQIKDRVGCDDTSCLAEIGGALGVDLLVSGNIAKLGDVFLLNLTLISPQQAEVAARTSRKITGGEAALVDEVPHAVAALFARPDATPVPAPATPTAGADMVTIPAGWFWMGCGTPVGASPQPPTASTTTTPGAGLTGFLAANTTGGSRRDLLAVLILVGLGAAVLATVRRGRRCVVGGLVALSVAAACGGIRTIEGQADATDCSSDESPGGWVYLPEYSIDRHEVTVAEFATCVEDGGCGTPPIGPNLPPFQNWGKTGPKPERKKHPINGVSWNDAVAYCAWVGKRLPTEAEWEKAARGTDGRVLAWGNAPPTCEYAVAKYARRAGCGNHSTWPVCSRPAGNSPYGLCDMSGNVWEWVADQYDSDYYSERASNVSPGGPSSGHGRVVRGGGWYDGPYELRVANRHNANERGRSYSYGFRCAR